MYNLGSLYIPTGAHFFQNCYHGDASSAHFLSQGRRSQTRPNALHVPQVLIPYLVNWVTGSFSSQRKPGYQFSLLLLEVMFPPTLASCPVRMRSSYLVLIAPSGSLLKPLQTSISSPFSRVCEFFLYELESSSNLQPASVILLSRALCWRKQKYLEAELGETNQDGMVRLTYHVQC